jgi:hypothetical protein
MELSPKETHDILGAKAQRAVAEQTRIEFAQLIRALEQNIGGVLALGRDPVIVHGAEEIFL